MNSIPPINTNIPRIQPLSDTQKTSASGSTQEITQSFGEMLNALDTSQQQTDALVEQLARGEDVDLHTVMIQLEENNVNFNVALGIRDKLVEAYREVMRMQV